MTKSVLKRLDDAHAILFLTSHVLLIRGFIYFLFVCWFVCLLSPRKDSKPGLGLLLLLFSLF